jgi:hypothetical protein
MVALGAPEGIASMMEVLADLAASERYNSEHLQSAELSVV